MKDIWEESDFNGTVRFATIQTVRISLLVLYYSFTQMGK